jgi:Coenzyme PQQ synthesis protein D (PqqD)
VGMLRSPGLRTARFNLPGASSHVVEPQQRYVVASARTGSERIDDELVVISFDTSHYYCLNPTATVVWALMSAGPHSAEEASQVLAGAHALDLAATVEDVSELLAGLEEERLVERSDDDPPMGAVELPEGSRAYVVPRFEKFGTLEQLMLAGE